MTPHLLNKEIARLSRFKGVVYIVPNTEQMIVRRVCKALGISYLDVTSDCRKTYLVTARFILAHELRKQDLTLERIGQILHRTHGTVNYYLKQYDNLKSVNDKDFAEMLKRVK